MHLTVVKSDLLRLLDLARTFSDRDPPKPILRNALLSVVEAGDHQLLRVTASDLLQTLTTHASCSASELGAVALSARALYDVVSTLPDGPVELREDGTRVAVGAGRRWSKLPFEVAKNFPEMPSPDTDTEPVVVDASLLVSLIERTWRCAMNDPTRIEMSSILLEIGDGVARAVALDGARVAVASEPYSGDAGMIAVVPIKAAKRLLTAMEKHTGQVLIFRGRLKENGAPCRIVQFGSVQFATACIDHDRYPGVKDALALDRPEIARVSRKALLDGCGAVRKILSGDDYPSASFDLAGSELTISTVSKSTTRTSDDTICGIEHARPRRWNMNIDNLADVLTPLSSDIVILGLGDPNHGLSVTVPDSDAYLALVSLCHL